MSLSYLVVCPTGKPGTILTWAQVPQAARDFSPSQPSVRVTVSADSLSLLLLVLWCPYSPRVQPHLSTPVRTLKTTNTGSHTVVWTHENTAHTDRNGLYCSCSCCALPRKELEFPAP